MSTVGLHPDQAEALAGALRRIRNHTDDLAMDLHQALALSELSAPGVLAGLDDLGRASAQAGWSLSGKAQRLQGFHLSGLAPVGRSFYGGGASAGSRGFGSRAEFAPTGTVSLSRKGSSSPTRNDVWDGGFGPEDSRPDLTPMMTPTSGSWKPAVKARVIDHEASGRVGAHYQGSAELFRAGPLTVEASGEALAGAEYEASVYGDVDLKNGLATVGGSASGFAGVSAEGEVVATAGPVAATLGARGTAGVGGEANGSVNVDLKNGEVQAKVGVEAELAVSVAVDATVQLSDSVTAKAEAEAMAGLALKLNGEVDVSLDEIAASWEVGAALGIGGGFSVDVSFSPTGVVDDLGDLAGRIDFNPLDLDAGDLDPRNLNLNAFSWF